jgi:hypothetical protein
MTLASTRRPDVNETSDPTELLIREARAASRRRRLRGAAVLFAAVLIVAALLIIVGSSRTNPVKTITGESSNSSVSPLPTCLRSQIRVALDPDGAGLGNGAYLIRVTNASAKACSITGYPTVTGIFASGVQRVFKDTPNGYTGGLGTDPLSKAKPPVVTLRARHGVATAMVEADDNGIWPHPTCPGFTSHVITLPHVTGATYTFHSRGPDLYCFNREVHPFVPGPTGDAK